MIKMENLSHKNLVAMEINGTDYNKVIELEAMLRGIKPLRRIGTKPPKPATSLPLADLSPAPGISTGT